MIEMNDRQRKLVFAGIVVALAFIGIYLTLPSPDSPAKRATSKPTSTGDSALPTGPTTAPPGISTPISPDNFDIYQLLPFSKADFAAAADVGQRFMVAYETYRFDDTQQTYTQRFQGLLTTDLQNQLTQSFLAPGLIDQRKQDQEVAQGSATIDSVRTFGATSITFLITGHQQLSKAGHVSPVSQQYAVTVAHTGTSWQTYSVEPSSIGQSGDSSGQGPG
jgi:hypothetical protein